MADETSLRAQLLDAALISEPAGRALEVVAILNEAIAEHGSEAVLVGGAAVYLWTRDAAFLTADIDVVVATTPRLQSALRSLGFEPASDGRHWHVPGSEVFLEAPSAYLDADAKVTSVVAPSGRRVSVLSPDDVLLERLAEFQATGHQGIARQALVLLARSSDDEQAELTQRAKSRRVGHALRAIDDVIAQLRAKDRDEPTSDEWHEIARRCERAEYHQSGDDA